MLGDEHEGTGRGMQPLRAVVAVFAAPMAMASQGCAARRSVSPHAEFPKK